MSTGYTSNATTVGAMADLYRKANYNVRAAFIPDGGYESVYVGSKTYVAGKVCSYCRREKGQFPTCDGCGASEWV